MKKYTCHICGFDGLDEESYIDKERVPSHNTCDCCGCQFGYDDNDHYRRMWIESGGRWFDPSLKPQNWNMKDQLKKINIDI